MKSDGIVGPKTISVLKKPRHDASKDIGAGISVYMSDSVVTYTVSDATPGYLSRQGVLDEIDDAFAMWSAASGVSLSVYQDLKKAPTPTSRSTGAGRATCASTVLVGLWQRRIRSP